MLLFLAYGIKAQKTDKDLNIILMIGDGMGVAQVSTAYFFGDTTPNFSRFPITGLHETSSTSHLITDSAAGATAFSTGSKTYKRAIGVNSDSLAVPTMLETLQLKNYKTGLVSISSITHATPAAFYAHVKDRDMHEDIAHDLVKRKINFISGGGLKYFIDRKDHKNLLNEFQSTNYHIDTVGTSTPSLKQNNLYLLAEDGLPNKDQNRGEYLPEATIKALKYFESQSEPFFLMIEGSYIDWGGHSKSEKMVINEVKDFDKSIGIALDFVEKHPNTLLIVTADHETGGVSLGKKMVKDPTTGKMKEIPSQVQIDFNHDQHTATLVPVFAIGHGQELFSGIYPNSEIYHKIFKAIEQFKAK